MPASTTPMINGLSSGNGDHLNSTDSSSTSSPPLHGSIGSPYHFTRIPSSRCSTRGPRPSAHPSPIEEAEISTRVDSTHLGHSNDRFVGRRMPRRHSSIEAAPPDVIEDTVSSNLLTASNPDERRWSIAAHEVSENYTVSLFFDISSFNL